MMDFGKILQQWETKRRRADSPAEAVQPAWSQQLDRFGPNEQVLREKAEPQAPAPKTTVTERANFPVQDEIDLHGLTQAEALSCLERFLKDSQAAGLKKVSVVHGKGLHSAGEPVLKKAVRDSLDRSPRVEDWGERTRKDGGTGAVWVWLSVRGK